jgi:alpha-galactosidase
MALIKFKIQINIMKKALFVFMGVICFSALAQQTNLFTATPPMGWNSWNKFQCDINEDIIRRMADAMATNGMKDAGYQYINIDDCWHGQRDAEGFIQPDPKKFPSGMKALADYVHSKGLKLGIYSDAGAKTCDDRPGSRGHEYQDALTYAQWDIDYLKYDWCGCEDLNARRLHYHARCVARHRPSHRLQYLRVGFQQTLVVG